MNERDEMYIKRIKDELNFIEISLKNTDKNI